MYICTGWQTHGRNHFYFLTNVSWWWGKYSCCCCEGFPPFKSWRAHLVVGELLHLDDVVQVQVHQGRDQVAAIYIIYNFVTHDKIDDYKRWDCLWYRKLSNVEIDEKSLHIRKFFYVCRWCEAVQEFNYLKMTIKRILKMKRMLTMKIDCASFCSEPASSYDVTSALHHKDKSTITIASHGERKLPIFLDITARVKWEWFTNTYVFMPHVLQHPQLSVRSLCVYCWLQVKWFLPQEIIQEIEHKKLYVRNNAQKIIHEKLYTRNCTQ